MTDPELTLSAHTVTTLLPLTVVAAAAVYLLLPGQLPAGGNRLRLAACAAGVLAVCGLGGQLLRPVEWWPESAADGTGQQLMLAAISLAAVLAAAVVVLAGDPTKAAWAFLVLIVAVAALLLLAGAPVPALILVAGCALWWVFRTERQKERDRQSSVVFTLPHEPLLACLTGTLLTVLLLSVIDHALVAEADPGLHGARHRSLPGSRTLQRVLEQEPRAVAVDPEQSQFEGLFYATLATQPVTAGLLAAAAVIVLLAGMPRRPSVRDESPPADGATGVHAGDVSREAR